VSHFPKDGEMTLFRVVIEHPDGQEQEIGLDRVLERILDYVAVTMSMGHTVRVDQGKAPEPHWRTYQRHQPTDPMPPIPPSRR
jgi:hypothetical protein